MAATPVVTTGSASAITSTGATLDGTVDPGGDPTTYHFEYGTNPSAYSNITAESGPITTAGPRSVSATVSGLPPNSPFYFRLVATDTATSQVVAGADVYFVTALGPPVVALRAATAITPRSLVANAVVDDPNNGYAINYDFEWGPTAAYGQTTMSRLLDTSTATGPDKPIAAEVSGLDPGTTYHVRAVADNGIGGPQATPDQVVITLADAATTPAMNVTTSSAILAGVARGTSLAGDTYRFSVSGVDAPAGIVTPARLVAADGGAATLTEPISGLLPGHTYAYRVGVTNASGTSYGAPQTFTTDGGAAELTVAPQPDAGAAAYGCAAPWLETHGAAVSPGQAVDLAGTDLGVFGAVDFGGTPVRPTTYSSNRVTAIVPAAARGSLAITVNCGRASNTIYLKVMTQPSNVFTSSATVKGTSVTLKARIPGPGTLTVTGRGITPTSTKVDGPGPVTVRAALTATGRSRLAHAKSRKLAIRLTTRFTPSGGNSRAVVRTITFVRKAGR